jgi:hypothetical protein
MRRGVQRYRCASCGHQFQSARKPTRMQHALWNRYAKKYDTIDELTEQTGRSERWVRTQLAAYTLPPHTPTPRPIVAVADATYFGKARSWGMLVIRDPHEGENLYWEEIWREAPSDYQHGVATLEQQGFTIQALVIDGRNGVREAFPGIPIQMCQFHQLQIVTRYLTKHPKLPAGQELRAITCTIARSTEVSFARLLNAWEAHWHDFLREKVPDADGKRFHYVHRRLRSAYFSLRRNLPFLFTFERYPELHIPNTTNSLDGTFSHLKAAIKIHRGLTKSHKKKMLEILLRKKRKTQKRRN